MNNVVHNGGPRYEEFSGKSFDPIPRYKLNRRRDDGGDRQDSNRFRSRLEGDSLTVSAPPITARSNAAPRKISKKVDKIVVNRGWKNAGPEAEVAEARKKIRAAAKPPAELPPEPKFEKHAEQKAEKESAPERGKKPGKKPSVAEAPAPSETVKKPEPADPKKKESSGKEKRQKPADKKASKPEQAADAEPVQRERKNPYIPSAKPKLPKQPQPEAKSKPARMPSARENAESGKSKGKPKREAVASPVPAAIPVATPVAEESSAEEPEKGKKKPKKNQD